MNTIKIPIEVELDIDTLECVETEDGEMVINFNINTDKVGEDVGMWIADAIKYAIAGGFDD